MNKLNTFVNCKLNKLNKCAKKEQPGHYSKCLLLHSMKERKSYKFEQRQAINGDNSYLNKCSPKILKNIYSVKYL